MSGSEDSSIKQICPCAAGRSDASSLTTFLPMKKLSKKTLAIIVFALVVLLMAVVCVFVGIPLARFVSKPDEFRVWINSFGVWGSLVFILLTAFQTIFAFIPGEPFELFAGYAFGFWQGTLFSLLGIIIGSIVVFLFTKKFGSKFVELFFSKEKIESIKFFKDKKKLYIITFIVFFIPGTPKDLLTYVSGLTPLKLWHWLLLTSIARIPSIVTSTISGNALGEQEYVYAIITFAVTLVISIIGLLIYNKINKEN